MNLVNMSHTALMPLKVYLYNKGQMTMPSDTAVYGSTLKTYRIKPNTSYVYEYRILQDDILSLDQPARRCHDDSEDLPSVSQCIAEYFEATYNCSLYMLDSLGKREDCTGDYASYSNVNNSELRDHWARKTELEIYNLTGCMPSCQGKQIQLETKQEITTESWSNDPKIELWFEFRDGMYNINEEYLVYDYNNFIADIGGYLGLLLGHSILSIYSMSADWITKPIRTIKKWLSPGSKKK